MSETNEKRLNKMEEKIKKLQDADKVLRSVKELKELGNQVQDLQIARKEKEIRELKDKQWTNRDACGRKVKKPLYNAHGEEI